MIVMKLQKAGRCSVIAVSYLLSGICQLKRLSYLQIKSAKHCFDWDFPQSGTVPIKYLAQGFHWEIVEIQEYGIRNKWNIL
jgi:hypothetical protein